METPPARSKMEIPSDVSSVTAQVAKTDEKKANHVTLTVLMQQHNDVSFKIKRTTPLSKLMKDYCDRLGLKPKLLRFSYDSVKIRKDQTADELEMEDGDVIDVWSEQLGGGGVAVAAAISNVM